MAPYQKLLSRFVIGLLLLVCLGETYYEPGFGCNTKPNRVAVAGGLGEECCCHSLCSGNPHVCSFALRHGLCVTWLVQAMCLQHKWIKLCLCVRFNQTFTACLFVFNKACYPHSDSYEKTAQFYFTTEMALASLHSYSESDVM